MKELMGFIGLSPQRLRVEWIATSEGNKFANVVNDFTRSITDLGPSPLRKARFEEFAANTRKQVTL